MCGDIEIATKIAQWVRFGIPIQFKNDRPKHNIYQEI